MKYEWRKSEKELYLPGTEPRIVAVPKQKFVAIKGAGDPNGVDFAERIGVLYSLAYAVRMMPKSGFTPDGYFEYAVYPLEGLWEGDPADKSSLSYVIMIRQPDFVTDEIFTRATETTKKKKPHSFLSDALFCEMEDGTSVQMLHIGDYDDEPSSFAKMDEFTKQNGLVRNTGAHREIYLTDASKTERTKLKTVLRYGVGKS